MYQIPESLEIDVGFQKTSRTRHLLCFLTHQFVTDVLITLSNSSMWSAGNGAAMAFQPDIQFSMVSGIVVSAFFQGECFFLHRLVSLNVLL